MPLTFAHPAAVLPFSRNSRYLNFLAMVLGSMAPDFEYFLHGQPHAVIGHTFLGFFVYNLPLVAVVYCIYSAWVHRALFAHLPGCLQDTYIKKPHAGKVMKLIVFVYSALLGMLTHVVWDAFTHSGGFMVRNIAFLNTTVTSFEIPIYKFLQHGGTLIGLGAILIYLFVRTRKYKTGSGGNATSKQKAAYWGLIACLTILFFGFWFVVNPVAAASYGILVVRLFDSALIALFVVSLYFGRKILN